MKSNSTPSGTGAAGVPRSRASQTAPELEGTAQVCRQGEPGEKIDLRRRSGSGRSTLDCNAHPGSTPSAAPENPELIECRNCPKKFHPDALCSECGGCLELCCLCNVPNSDEEYEEIVAARKETIFDDGELLEFGGEA